MRLHTFYEKQQAALRAAGSTRCPTLRVTPGMLAELNAEWAARCAQLGMAPEPCTRVMTCQGAHKVELIECPTRAAGHNVILAPREDLFVETDSDVGIQMVSLENDVTAIPDNIACVEVISVGELVQNVEAGQLVFIDFFDVKQGYILANDELYLAGCEAFKAKFDANRQAIVPLSNYVVTKHAPERFKVALTGTDRVHIPDYVTTSGIAGGKTSSGGTSTEVLYQEVVAVGPLTAQAFPGLMTRAERSFLDYMVREHIGCDKYDGIGEEGIRLLCLIELERQRGRPSDIAPGDLVVFCRDVAQKMRVRGEFQHLLPYSAVLATIDDDEILKAGIRKGKAGRIIRAA